MSQREGPSPDYEYEHSEPRNEPKVDPTRACDARHCKGFTDYQDACRKMKIRCIDKENPPCKRCRHMKLECRFAPTVVTQRVRNPSEQGEGAKHRLDSLEGQVHNMNQKLDEISSFLFRLPGMTSSPRPNGSSHGRADSERGHGQRHGHDLHSLAMRASGRESAERHEPRPSVGPHRRSLQFTEYDQDVAAMSPMNRLRPSGPEGHEEARWGRGAEVASPGKPVGEKRQYEEMNRHRRHEDDDPLEAAVRMEPFRLLTMKEEEMRLRAERHHDESRHNDTKRRRLSGTRRWSPPSEADIMREDPVSLGYCSEDEGRQLFEAFFQYAHRFIPILDPNEDTWHDLRPRSPLCITVILLIASRAREACAPPSEFTRRCQALAEAMAKMTLFSPISTLETAQALTLMASFGDSSWRPGCHAMTVAVDMGLFRCLPHLHRMSSNPNPTRESIERQRPLVVGARIWLALVKLTYEMSLTHALPLPFPSPAHYPADYARELLEHPLSTIYDARLVVSVEMLQVRETVFRPYEQLSDVSELDNKLRAVNQEIRTRFEYWAEYYSAHGVPPDHFLVREITSQRAYATIYTNSCALHGVRDAADVAKLSYERRQWLGSALRAAAFLVASIGSGPQEKGSEFANHYFHIGVVATARYLIRMAGLLPEVCDLYQVSLDMDKLILKLPTYPGHPFTDLLRSSVAKARQQGVLPYTSLSEQEQLADPPAAPEIIKVANSHHPDRVENAEIQITSPFPWNMPIHNPAQSGLDQLAQVGEAADDITWLNDFNFAAWFPLASGDPGSIGNVDLSSIPHGQEPDTWYPGSWFPGPMHM